MRPSAYGRFAALAAALLSALLMTTGAACSRRIEGSHSWWDDRSAQPLPPGYRLPPAENIAERDSWSAIIEENSRQQR